jgi:hypothetical protein
MCHPFHMDAGAAAPNMAVTSFSISGWGGWAMGGGSWDPTQSFRIACAWPWCRSSNDVTSTFHGQGETLVHLLKWVRMQPSTAADVSVIFLGGGVGGDVSRSIVSRSDPGEATIDGDVRGCRSPRWRRYGGLLDRMMATYALLPPWGASSLEPFISWTDVWTAWWLCASLRMFLAWGPRWSNVSSTSPGSIVHWDINKERRMIDSRMAVMPSGVMVSSMVGLARFMH